ncbi:IclR family transcriptional regulator [Ramlibacter henchirensis]|nr:IclR family transcriptional regulator [Ramlibacter henchirensis]
MAVNETGDEQPGAASVQAVGVAFAVLESLSQTPDAIGTSDLARRLGMTKARVHRHLSTLRLLGFVEKDSATDGYRLGWKSYKLGMAVAENFGLRRIAHRHLLRLHKDSGQTVALAMPAGPDAITVIETIEAPGVVAITVKPGSVIPAPTAALGRAILAFRDNTQEEASFQSIRDHWYAVAINERIPGVAALAAPVFDDSGRPVASVGVIGSQAHVTQPPRQDLLAQVQEAASRISSALRSTRWRSAPGPHQHRQRSTGDKT